ncbi:MAG: ubiquinol-cytochrome c reductase iron-sulfur subunit, partial [Nitrosospira sp.]|nr:ubiquinol-cytochrome c reductase iron-sulfur subunit [Nitrosospira sp.]
MDSFDKSDKMSNRRRFLVTATSVAGGIAATAWA